MGLAGPQPLGLGALDRGHGRRLGAGAPGRAVLALAALADRVTAASPPSLAVLALRDRASAAPSRSPAARRAPASAAPPSRRGPRSLARCGRRAVVVTSGRSSGGASSSSRSGSLAGPLVGTTPVISMPSTKNSASTLQDVADLGAVGHQRGGDGARAAPWRRPPATSTSRRRASCVQLDVDPAGHGGWLRCRALTGVRANHRTEISAARPNRSRRRFPGMGPLHGVRVVEIAGIGPAPFCAMVLADLGAEVVRVDRADAVGADPDAAGLRRARPRPSLGRRRPQGAGRRRGGPAARRAGRRPHRGLPAGGGRAAGRSGPSACLARNPRLVYGRMTGWGQEGPLADRGRHDITYIAVGGRARPHRSRRTAADAAAQPGGRLRRRRDAAGPRAAWPPCSHARSRARARWSTPRWSTAPPC